MSGTGDRLIVWGIVKIDMKNVRGLPAFPEGNEPDCI